MQLVLTAEPIDAQRALQCNLVTKVVSHDRLLEETELVAQQILRNSQRAIRSAKETILGVIGKQLDDQLRIEGWNAPVPCPVNRLSSTIRSPGPRLTSLRFPSSLPMSTDTLPASTTITS